MVRASGQYDCMFGMPLPSPRVAGIHHWHWFPEQSAFRSTFEAKACNRSDVTYDHFRCWLSELVGHYKYESNLHTSRCALNIAFVLGVMILFSLNSQTTFSVPAKCVGTWHWIEPYTGRKLGPNPATGTNCSHLSMWLHVSIRNLKADHCHTP